MQKSFFFLTDVQQKTTLGSTPVSQEQETEATTCTGLSKLENGR